MERRGRSVTAQAVARGLVCALAWSAAWAAGSGRAQSIPPSRSAPPDPSVRAAASPRASRAGLRATTEGQRAHGIPIDDHGRRVVRDRHGHVRQVAGATWVGAVPAPVAGVPPASARRLAAARLGVSPDALSTSLAWRLAPDGLRLVQRVSGRVGLVPWRVDVDAADARLLEVRELTSHGGSWSQAPPPVVGRGRGLGYRDVAAALASRERPVALPHLRLEDSQDGALRAGTLSGATLQVTGADGWSPEVPDRRFLFDDDSAAPQGPWVPEYQLFDQVNTYAWASRAVERTGWQPDAVHRVWVNWDGGGGGYANAFFAPLDPDPTGDGPSGFLVFGEWSGATGVPDHDASRDPSVVAHEVAHMALFGLGFRGGLAPVDTPPRALNEGLADAFAALWLGDPVVGRVLAHHGSALGVTSRDLREPRTLPDDLWSTTGTATGLPSEHRVGHILGAALWRLGTTLGRRRTIDLIFDAAPLLPASPAELGWPLITGPVSAAATLEATSRTLHTLADLAREQAPHRGDHVLGAALAHGLLTEEHAQLDLSGPRRRALVPGAFLPGTGQQVLTLSLHAGQSLDVTLTSREGRPLQLTWEAGPDGELPLSEGPPRIGAGGTRVRWQGCRAPVDGRYRLVLEGESGGWRLSLRATRG